jgi:hypothetical protein
VVQQPADQAGQHRTQPVTLADVLAQLETLVRLQQMANDRHEADARPVPLWKSYRRPPLLSLEWTCFL